jgi:hypothetical protein
MNWFHGYVKKKRLPAEQAGICFIDEFYNLKLEFL